MTDTVFFSVLEVSDSLAKEKLKLHRFGAGLFSRNAIVFSGAGREKEKKMLFGVYYILFSALIILKVIPVLWGKNKTKKKKKSKQKFRQLPYKSISMG